MTDPAAVLEALLADPGVSIGHLSPEQAAALLARLSNLQALLLERAATSRVFAGGERHPSPPTASIAPAPAWSEADLLTVDEAAAMLRMSRRWLYRRAPTLPFARKLSRKALRFSRTGLVRWLATRHYDSGANRRYNTDVLKH